MLKKIIYSLCVLTACSSQLRSMEEKFFPQEKQENLVSQKAPSFRIQAIQYANTHFPTMQNSMVYFKQSQWYICGYDLIKGDDTMITPSSIKMFQNKDIDLSKRTMRHFIYLKSPVEDFWKILQENKEIKHLAISMRSFRGESEAFEKHLFSTERTLDTLTINFIDDQESFLIWKSINNNFHHIRYTHILSLTLGKRISITDNSIFNEKKSKINTNQVEIKDIQVSYYPLFNVFLKQLSGIHSLKIENVSIELNNFFDNFNLEEYYIEKKLNINHIKMNIKFFCLFKELCENGKQIIFAPHLINSDNPCIQNYCDIMKKNLPQIKDFFVPKFNETLPSEAFLPFLAMRNVDTISQHYRVDLIYQILQNGEYDYNSPAQSVTFGKKKRSFIEYQRKIKSKLEN